MNLRACLDIGKFCGLETVGEAIRNIDMHCISIFNQDAIGKELNELYGEYAKYCLDKTLNKDTSIKDAYLIIK